MHLPARELGAVVGKDQFDIAYDLFRVLEYGSFIHIVYKVLPAAAERDRKSRQVRQLYYFIQLSDVGP